MEHTTQLSVCPQCGTIECPAFSTKCDCCWIGFLKRPRKLFFTISDQQLTQLYESERKRTTKCGLQEYRYVYWYNALLKDCPEYDNNLYEKHLNNNRRWDSVVEKRVASLQSRPTVKCPYCGSLRTTKISTSSRVASSLTLGLASNKIGKNYQCNDCKATF